MRKCIPKSIVRRSECWTTKTTKHWCSSDCSCRVRRFAANVPPHIGHFWLPVPVQGWVTILYNWKPQLTTILGLISLGRGIISRGSMWRPTILGLISLGRGIIGRGRMWRQLMCLSSLLWQECLFTTIVATTQCIWRWVKCSPKSIVRYNECWTTKVTMHICLGVASCLAFPPLARV